jgi:putative transposase
MARLPRLQLAGYCTHILLRSHNQIDLFLDDNDYIAYIQLLIKNCREYEFLIHAYVLLPNHIHIIGTPKTEYALSKTLQAIGREYTLYFNARYQRRGTVWDGRFRSSLIQADVWLLRGMLALELHPILTGLVLHPQQWLWSSYMHHCGAQRMAWLSDPMCYWALGNTPFERQSVWGRLSSEGLAQQERDLLMAAVRSGWPLGDEKFHAGLALHTQRPTQPRSPGRPRQRKRIENVLSPI